MMTLVIKNAIRNGVILREMSIIDDPVILLTTKRLNPYGGVIKPNAKVNINQMQK